ncbi:M48 family metalloprotease [Conexibacter sp. DBS9H8]|uniref:M48 family metalloprotease n=1 Tax=Conexibacter sp. DBS9H8 TaxID=2937801 RepID=UPI002010B238|nr:M48 family metalloprotease [Conexibacter sp. DBS9H8]
MGAGTLTILALAAVLALLPAAVDRWASRRGASPQALIVLASITLAGIGALPVALIVCLSARGIGRDRPLPGGLVVLLGLVLLAVLAGRATARTVIIRRRWRALAEIAHRLTPTGASSEVAVIPVSDLLAFAAGSQTFVSRGLLERLSPSETLAVIEHEREHADHHHGRLLMAATAITHASFNLAPARRAAQIITRELDVLADRAAAHRLGDASAVQSALETISGAGDPADGTDPATLRRRLDRLGPAPGTSPLRAESGVRLATLAVSTGILITICLSVHTTSLWLGIATCTLLVISLWAFVGPVVGPRARRGAGSG